METQPQYVVPALVKHLNEKLVLMEQLASDPSVPYPTDEEAKSVYEEVSALTELVEVFEYPTKH